MKSRIGKSRKNSSRDRAPATRTGIREVAPAVFSQDGVDTVTREEIRGKTILAKGSLHQHFDDKGDEILGD
jgi:hypothetical protein